MSLKLLLDEDSQAKGLLNLLREAGHDAVTVNEVGLTSKPDSVVLDYARQQGRVLLSRNCDDFNNLHNADPNHAGILVIYQNSDRSKNMNYKTIVRCVTNLENAGCSLGNQFITLKPWNYRPATFTAKSVKIFNIWQKSQNTYYSVNRSCWSVKAPG